MTALNGLIVVIDVAQRKRDDAGLVLVQVQRHHASAQQQMDQLQGYAVDTESRWSAPAQVHATPQIMAHYYQFMARLQQTIELQQGVIADLQRQCQMAKQFLLEAEIRVAGLTRLLEKRRSVLARALARGEQKESDEFAARQMRRIRTELETRENL